MPKNTIEVLTNCNEDILSPTIYRFFILLATLPVTTTSSERSFSKLRHLKSYLRSMNGENCLNGWAVMNIHCDILVSTAENVMNEISIPSRQIRLM